MLLTTDNPKLIRIPINDVCYNGWAKTINGHQIELDLRSDGIALTTDGYLHPIRGQVYEWVIKNLQLRHGGYCPYDKRYVYYVYGRDGKRYKDLYLFGTNIGTRADFGLRYPCQVRSKTERKRSKKDYRNEVLSRHELKKWKAVDERQQERRAWEKRKPGLVLQRC